MPLSVKDIRELLLSLWPPGQLYDWYTPASKVSRLLDGLAEAIKTFGYDLVERLRRELNPATAVEKLPDWENALFIDDSYTARHGTVPQRQAAVVGKLREFGAFTLGNTRAILGPQLGYLDPSRLMLLETDRAKMRAAHSYTDGKSYGPAILILASTYVSDGGVVSWAGAQLDLELLALPAEPFEIYLISPLRRQKAWSSAALGPPATRYRLYAPEFAGDECLGLWFVALVAESPTNLPGLTSWSLFVEGTGEDGLSKDMSAWGAFLDPTFAGKGGTPADSDGARASISRIQHAHTDGVLLLSLLAVPDDPRSLPNACLPV